MNRQIIEKYNLVNDIVKEIDNKELTVLASFLGDRIKHLDSYVMMLGETSSGKSTIINGLIEKNILLTSSAPSTASITEVEFKEDVNENLFYAINKNATIEKINNEKFNALLKKPNDALKRLKLVIKTNKYNLSNMRLFDTPGYGSIIKEHEEVLKEFIPNSDIIIYTVNYRIGIQENDYSFLRFLKHLIRDDIEIILVINRCPVNIKDSDRRIVEIKKYITDILHKNIKTFCVKKEIVEDEDSYPLPKAEELWKYVEGVINSPKRNKLLEDVFEGYIIDLLEKCENILHKDYQNIKLSKEMKEKIEKRSKKFSDNINNLIPSLVEPTFDKLIKNIPYKLETAKFNINSATKEAIDKVNNGNMNETIIYVSNHLVPYKAEKEVSEIQRYIGVILDNLNSEINDYLNSEIIELNKDIKTCFETATELTVKDFGKNVGKKVLTSGLTNYFAAFGGAGGAGAGVANATSHALKVVGDFFGKTFKRETHNALKHFLSKIGATSIKAISSAVTIIIECATVIIDYSTWKDKLKKKVGESIEIWYTESCDSIKNDLLKLKEENIKTLKSIVEEEKNKYCYKEEIKDELKIVKLLQEVEKVKLELGA